MSKYFRRIIIIGIIVCFIICIVPIIYLAPYDRATGDDFGYGLYTHLAIVHQNGVGAFTRGIIDMIKGLYIGWQGTWFSIILFSLQPEVFDTKWYFITPYISSVFWVVSTFVVVKDGLKLCAKELENGWIFVIAILFWLINLEFIPGTKSSLYWWNGCMHYMIPFCLCQACFHYLIKYLGEHKIKDLVIICILATCLGGSNYQVALLCLLIMFFILIYDTGFKKNKFGLYLLLPFVLEMIGLIISMKAPGNKARGGEDFGFDFGRIISVIGQCFIEAFKEAIYYLIKLPILTTALIMLLVLLLYLVSKFDFQLKHKGILLLVSVCIYAAMQAPELYANVKVSQGVGNTNFQSFMWLVFVFELILADDLSHICHIGEKGVLVIGMCCLVCAVLFRTNIKIMNSYICYDYIRSGQAADFKMQMDEQTQILMSDELDIVVPFINHEQGPFMHMPIIENSEAFTNIVVRDFYEKNSVVAVPREEYYKNYSDKN